MADRPDFGAEARAEVVPLRRQSAPDFPEPLAHFSDAAEPERTLSVTWSPDHRLVQVSVGRPGETEALQLDADHVLDLVRALIEGLPEVGAGCPRPPATVLPMHPRPHK
jgi:hypothetical protein